ncbi:MAG: xanthine dehydrogenase family protein subunit M [Pseudomonadota bacterium]
MTPFDYVKPKSLTEALAAWTPGAAWLGGGTNLVDLMKTGATTPDRLIDITGLADLDAVSRGPNGDLLIGALVTNADLASHPEVLRHAPMVAEATLSGASGQIRNVATLAGNIMQSPRDALFDHVTPAADPLSAEPGSLAILGTGGAPAVAVHPSDLCVTLAALDAVVEIAGPNGTRDVALTAFHNLPGATARTALAPSDLITGIRLPASAMAFAAHARYLKVRSRTSYAFALCSAAAALRFEGDRIVEARLCLGAVAPKPWRAAEAEACISGQVPDAALFAKAADVALAGAEATPHTSWKTDLARRTAQRALEMAAHGTPAEIPALPASPFSPQSGEPAHV